MNHGATLTVDLAALAANWRLLAARAAPGECAGVVKANGYGLGIPTIVPALWQAGCRTFFVAHLSEGIAARRAAPEAVIYVLNGLATSAMEDYAAHILRPVLGAAHEVAAWAAFRADNADAPPAALHIDTGLNRLGFSLEAAQALVVQGGLTSLTIALILTHLVSAEIPDSAITAHQINRFNAMKAEVLAKGEASPRFSLQNSSGLFLEAAGGHELARPGYALYGGNPVPHQQNPMREVVRLEAPIVQINLVPAGETVGYNENGKVNRASRIATLSCGYADGYPRSAGNNPSRRGGSALIAGKSCPFIGNISMDLITVDITNLPEGAVKPGDKAVLIGDSLTLDTVGEAAGTNGYEILTHLGQRYVRRYL